MNVPNIPKLEFIYKFLVLVLYLSLFQPILNGFLLFLVPSIAPLLKILIQSIIYILPFGIILIINKYSFRTICVIVFLVYTLVIHLTISNEHTSVIFSLLQIKVIVLPLLYIPIIEYITKYNNSFFEQFKKHIEIIFFITASVTYFELVSRYIDNPLYYAFLSLAHDSSIAIPFSRPIGISLNIHSQAYILSVAILYFLIQKKYFVVIFMFIAFFMTGSKTWMFALFIAGIYYFFTNTNKIKLKDTLYIFICFCAVFIIIYFIFYEQIIHFISEYSLSSNSMNIFTHLWSDLFKFIEISLLPNGFVPDEYRINSMDYQLSRFTDAILIWYIYQMGILGALMYVAIVYYPVFRKNKYNVIVILSLFAMFHTNQLQFINNLILLVFFASYRIREYQNSLKGNEYKKR